MLIPRVGGPCHSPLGHHHRVHRSPQRHSQRGGGRQGVAFMLDNARRAGLRQYILAPSCVPAVPGLDSVPVRPSAPRMWRSCWHTARSGLALRR